MHKTYKSIDALNEHYPLKEKNILEAVTKQFNLSITDELLHLINPNDPNDPIAQQFIPQKKELISTKEESLDPIGDNLHSPVKGIIHRYPDRLLLTPILLCPVYCRFCFRREKVSKSDETLKPEELKTALHYIKSTPQIWEVILSGGDPLLLSPRRLQIIFEQLDQIPHVKIIRIHTRIPILTPERITNKLIQTLSQTNKTLWIVLHTNHVNELTEKAKQAIDKLNKASIPLLSQTVLLKKINDKAETLETLFRKLIEWRIKPYYLHQGDLAKGTGHFRTQIKDGQKIMRTLHKNLSGIARPTYMLDSPKGKGKIPLTPHFAQA